ncbi:MAG TPA: glycosyltransferase [Candidatus Baltobacteraceae bacterium]|nr:glycosyltransferase [Candidatus Baltobacteraceae bacterium]
MAKAPAFSVVIPAYNCAPYVAQAVQSALDQTIDPSDREIIVIDDGSTDATADVVERFGQAVRFISQPNGGVAKARNSGIAQARGRYIAFLDADDYWFPPRLDLATALFVREPHCFVNSEVYIERGGVRESIPYYRSRSQRGLFSLDAETQMEFSIEDNFINSMAIVPREAIDEVGVFDIQYRYGEDWHLWLRLLAAGWPVRLIESACAVYRFGRSGATTSHHDYGMARDRVRVLSQYPDFVSPHRWQKATGLVHHLGLREAVGRAALGAAIVHGMWLAANPGYVREVFHDRRTRRL